LYSLGVQQSQQPEPLAGVSILTFHDSIELFLQLACEKWNVTKQSQSLMDYWNMLQPLGLQLTQKESVRRLNRARVDLKHHGILPSKLDIESFRGSVTSFFADNTHSVFGISFDAISMLGLVQCREARSNLEEAEKHITAHNGEDALDKIALAFAQIIDDYENRKRSHFGVSPFFFGESLTFESSFFMGIKHGRFGTFVDKVKDSIEAMQKAMKILSLGLDYRRYVRFRLLTPNIIGIPGGDYVIQRGHREEAPSSLDLRFCFDFVIESAIRLQGFDFAVEHPQ
jgi:hypothetical protein